MKPKSVALRKRTQIAIANRVMFLWVAGVSVVFGFCIVGVSFLMQMLMFNERVLSEKSNTVKVLEANNKNIVELESKIRVLDTNQNLIDSKANPNDSALQVILDALPSDANSLALGASIQNKLLAGFSLESLQVTPVSGIETLSVNGDSISSSSGLSDEQNKIELRFEISAIDPSTLKKALQNVESSIRTIDFTRLKIESQGKLIGLSVQGKAFYEPARVVELKDKMVR